MHRSAEYATFHAAEVVPHDAGEARFETPEPEPEPEQLPLDDAGVTDMQRGQTFQITTPQIKKLQTLFGVMGVNNRAAKVAYLTRHAGRPLESSKDLTLDEAKAIINIMETEPKVKEHTQP
jgi:hypothetical protein